MSIEETIKAAVRESVTAVLADTEGGKPLLMKRERAAAELDLSPSSFDAARCDPTFPKPIYPPGCKHPRWRYADLRTWAANQGGMNADGQ